MQYKEVAVGLKVARRESQLSQCDVAYLLNTTQPRISRLERGKAILSVHELCTLAIIFDKQLTDMFQLLADKITCELAERLSVMPGDIAKGCERRQLILHDLAERLAATNYLGHAG